MRFCFRDIAGLIFVMALSFVSVFLTSCAHKLGPFDVKEDRQIHRESGVEIPKEFPHWLEQADSIKEKVSPEIQASISFQYVSEKAEWKPSSTIYICREFTTSNLKVVENRIAPTLQNMKFLKTESLKLKNKKRILFSTYQHQIPWAATAGSGAKTLKTLKSVSYFATAEKDSKIVVWVTVARDSLSEKEIAMDFIEKALFLKPASKALEESKPLPPSKLKKR